MYRIKVVTYLNPHLIWVEVGSKSEKAVFEQIGIYGVLPVNVGFDTDGALVTEKSEKWLPGASVILKNTLADAEEIWFRPIHIERRLSIFKDNIHKFGDIIVKKLDGEEDHVSIQLKQSIFAIYDASRFERHLNLGLLQTKLKEFELINVWEQLKKYYSGEVKSKEPWEEWMTIHKNNECINHKEDIPKTNVNEGVKAKHSNRFHITEKKLRELEYWSKINSQHAAAKETITDTDLAECANDSPKIKLLKWKIRKMKEKAAHKDMSASGDTASVTGSTITENDLDSEKLTQNSFLNNSANSVNSILDESLTENESLDGDVNKYAKIAIKAQKTIRNESKKSARLVYGPPDYIQLKDLTVKTEAFNLGKNDEENTPQTEETNFNKDHADLIDNGECIKSPPKMDTSESLESKPKNKCKNSSLLRKLELRKARVLDPLENPTCEVNNTGQEAVENNKVTNVSSDDESISSIIERLNLGNKRKLFTTKEVVKQDVSSPSNVKINANPYRNLDGSNSVFVDKLISTVLMVHTKKNNKIQPCSNIRDVPFAKGISTILKNMGVKAPTRMQTVSWTTILRGHSVFMVGPLGCGKTIGYLPAVCSLIIDSRKQNPDNVYPFAIILCATASSVAEVEKCSKILFGLEERVFACYAGMDELTVTTSLLNGCDLLICTPPVLVRLLQAELGIDLRALTTFVIDDSERIFELYLDETKLALYEIKKVLKSRANKEMKVQIIVASRIWCEFLEPLAKKSPDTVVCIGSFQECVLYSKCRMTVDFVMKANKLKVVSKFLEEVVGPKRTVIVCRYDEEVAFLKESLKQLKYIVFACNNTMDVHELYNMNVAWGNYEEPTIGPVLICCDDNLIHLNITDAHYLLHYSMPLLFSTFSKRFSVLNDNYPSIFKDDGEKPRIKVLIEDSDAEQLPKILHFVKRCIDSVPEVVLDMSAIVLACRDIAKAKELVPICHNLLSFGICADFWSCKERHAILKDFDEPKEWVPMDGYINFKILHYHSAVFYSARLLSNTVNGLTKKYPQTYSTLPLKMGMYFRKESNRKLHGTPKIGDVCAVSVKLNFFARCQVIKILDNYKNGNPNHVLVRMIDEEKLERTRDIYLYHLSDELKEVQTYVIQVRLANIRPLDKDVTYSNLAKDHLKKITDADKDLYLRGQVAMAVGNCVFVNTLEACQDLPSLNDTVVRSNFKHELLNAHAEPNPDHIPTLVKMCKDFKCRDETIAKPDTSKLGKLKPKAQWAYFDDQTLTPVYWSSAENPDKFFVRLSKFNTCLDSLVKEINAYVQKNPEPVNAIEIGDIVLAKFPMDDMYERARIDDIGETTVKCFFVDHGDFKDISSDHLIPIPHNFITQLPFQAIECRLIGVKPAGNDWTEFCTNWFYDFCLTDSGGDVKQLYIKYFVKSTAECTEGHKYGVAIIDTNSDQDVVVNELMVDLNLAQFNEDERKYLDELTFTDDFAKRFESDMSIDSDEPNDAIVPFKKMTQPVIRSVSLDDSADDLDQWDCEAIGDIANENNANENLREIGYENVENNMAIVPFNTSSIVQFNQYMNAHAVSNIMENVEKEIKDLIGAPQPEKVNESVFEENKYNKPRLNWFQNKTSVTVKILLMGVENYVLDIKNRGIKFFTDLNGTKYGFEFDLYGAVDLSNCSHASKGQYILVKLTKIIKRNWLTLTKDSIVRKWIVYDADRLDTSSGEEDTDNSEMLNAIKNIHNKHESETDDDDYHDDVTFANKKYT